MKKTGIIGIILSLIIGITALLVYAPQIAGYISVPVLGSEMSGEVSKGSLCFLSSYKGEELSEGEVIGIKTDDGNIIRRIVKIKPLNGKIITKGDGNELIDESFLDKASVLGTLSFSFPLLGYVKAFLVPLWGKIVFFGVFAVILVLSLVLISISPKSMQSERKNKFKNTPPPQDNQEDTKVRFNFDD